jgi:hypothetical protein
VQDPPVDVAHERGDIPGWATSWMDPVPSVSKYGSGPRRSSSDMRSLSDPGCTLFVTAAGYERPLTATHDAVSRR